MIFQILILYIIIIVVAVIIIVIRVIIIIACPTFNVVFIFSGSSDSGSLLARFSEK